MAEVFSPTGEQLYDATLYTHDETGAPINPATKEMQEAQNAALAGLGTEATQLLVKAEIEAIGAKDSATGAKQDEIKTVLGALATEEKLELVRLLLASIESKLGTVEISNLPATQQIAGTVNVGNLPAAQEVVGAVEVSNLPVTQEVAGTVDVGNMPVLPEVYPVSINNNIATIKSAPVTGAKTVTATAAEVFAGASRLANRYQMVLQNPDTLIVYIGGAGVTPANGLLLLPGDSMTLKFKPDVPTPIYAISEGNNAIRVVELA